MFSAPNTSESLPTYKKAESLYEEVLKAREKGNDRIREAQTHSGWAKLCVKQAKYDEARNHFEKALSIGKEGLKTEIHPFIANNYYQFALLCQNNGQHGKTLSLIERAIDIAEKVWGKEHPTTLKWKNKRSDVNKIIQEQSRGF